jgi:hypothetical protein
MSKSIRFPELSDELARACIGTTPSGVPRLFLSVPLIAEMTDVDERTIRRAIAAGTFPGIRIQNTIRVPVAAFLRLCGLIDSDLTEGGPLMGETARLKS